MHHCALYWFFRSCPLPDLPLPRGSLLPRMADKQRTPLRPPLQQHPPSQPHISRPPSPPHIPRPPAPPPIPRPPRILKTIQILAFRAPYCRGCPDESGRVRGDGRGRVRGGRGSWSVRPAGAAAPPGRRQVHRGVQHPRPRRIAQARRTECGLKGSAQRRSTTVS